MEYHLQIYKYIGTYISLVICSTEILSPVVLIIVLFAGIIFQDDEPSAIRHMTLHDKLFVRTAFDVGKRMI